MTSPKRRFPARALIPALALLAVPGTARAQLSSPVGDQAQGASGAAKTASPSVAVPQTSVAQFQPAVIEAPASTAQTDPSAPPKDEAAPITMAKPVRPSEFETYVSDLAGKPLHRFGAELLTPEAGTFAAPPSVAVPGDYRLNPGDQLQLGLTGSVQAALRLTVDNEGRIFVPRVGAITVGGTRYADLHDVIAREVSRQYRQFNLDVTVARLRGITVYVTGFARRPGSITVSSLSTLVSAVMAAGGPSAGGSFRSLQLRRGGKLVSDFDLYDLLLKGDKTGDATLENGDVIYVAPAGDQVAVLGSVNQEAIFELAPNQTISDAIAYAGGTSTVADQARLLVLDTLGQKPGWQQLSADQARSTIVRRGAVVRVLSDLGIERPLGTQPVLITISGEVAKPGRYYVKPGTRLADVVAQAGGLSADAFPYASVITRESVKAQQRQSFDRAVKDMELLLTTQPLVSVNRAQMSSASSLSMIHSVVDQMRKREPTGRLVFDLPVNATALPGDVIVENSDSVFVPPRPVTIGVFGSVPSPASFAYHDGMSIGDFVKSAGGIQKLGDKNGVFVVRANGTVVAGGRRVLKAPALPGDLIFVPVDAARGEFWARLRDITGSLFSPLISAATIANAVN
ncbi:polysaccharide biosynthesis/export family protein [Sphingomonas sp. PL20]|uniref:polysaccharide biosynthesis/export family protein n=2 Tax=Pseudomonadota TaxID=1224 RepID=UPI001AE74327